MKRIDCGALPLLLETNDGVAQALVDIALYDLGPDYLRHYAERIIALPTREERSEAMKQVPEHYKNLVADHVRIHFALKKAKRDRAT